MTPVGEVALLSGDRAGFRCSVQRRASGTPRNETAIVLCQIRLGQTVPRTRGQNKVANGCLLPQESDFPKASLPSFCQKLIYRTHGNTVLSRILQDGGTAITLYNAKIKIVVGAPTAFGFGGPTPGCWISSLMTSSWAASDPLRSGLLSLRQWSRGMPTGSLSHLPPAAAHNSPLVST